MNGANVAVDILDVNGAIVGNKLRKDVVKGKDIYHAVYAVILTPENLIAISKIAQRQDLPNLHAGSYGCTAATIRRTTESSTQAMSRAISDELRISISPELFYEGMEDVDGTRRMVGLYILRSDVPTDFSTQDIQEITRFTKSEFSQKLASEPDQFTPLLRLFWKKYTT